MQIAVDLLFILLGATCIGYLWAGGSIFDREPPLLVLGVLLIALAAGLAGRSRAAALVARAGLGAGLVGIAWTATRYFGVGGLREGDELMRRLDVLGMILGAAGIVALFLLVRRLRPMKRIRLRDAVPLAAFGAVVALALLWFVADDTRLRPCRVGNEAACEVVATRLIEAAKRTPPTPPTRWEEDAARALNVRTCAASEPGPCALWRYAAGTVALRAGRVDAARDAFLRACDEDRSWCARAAEEKSLVWTPDERARLERP
jgi:hypothetical protein